MSVRVVDKGAARVVRTLNAVAGKAHVAVGIMGEDATKPASGGDEDITVLDVATWAEFGLGQPQRSWLRAWIDESEDKINARTRAEVKALVSGKRTRAEALGRLGAWVVGEIQKRIAAGIAPENAPATIAKKGSSTPLIDKGQFRPSINHRVEEK